MTILILKSNVSSAPYPSVVMRNYERQRGVRMMGQENLAGKLPVDIYFVADDGETPGLADYMSGIGFSLASKRLRKVLEDANAEVEFVPAPVYYHGNIVSEYSILNPIKRFRAIDMTLSHITLSSVGIALSAEKVVLNEAAFEGIPIAVIHELSRIAVQSELANKIMNSCVGCEFITADVIQF